MGLEGSLARALRQALEVLVNLVDRPLVDIPHDRDEEAVLGLNRDPDVVAVEIDDLVTLESGVQLGELGERSRTCLHRECDEPVQWHALEVTFLDPGDGGHLTMRASHVLGHHTSYSAQLLAPTDGRRASGCCANVLLGDPPARPRAGKGIQLDAELRGDPPDERRRLDALRRGPLGGTGDNDIL